MEVSVIVCTRNRARLLPACLASVEKACNVGAPGACELIIVDNASTDDTRVVARRWAQAASVPVVLVVEPRGGVSRAKNSGIAASRGRLLVLTDDDCQMDAHYIEDLLAHDRRDAGPVLRGGRVELGDPTDSAYTVKPDREQARYTGKLYPGGIVIGCNLAMRREVFARVGGFDERFGPGAVFLAGEDNDYILRAYYASIPVEYVPNMVVYHFHGRKRREDILALYKIYQEANGSFYAKHVFKHPQILKWIKWDLQKWMKELRGGEAADTDYDFSYTLKNTRAMRGVGRYYLHVMRQRVGALARRMGSNGQAEGVGAFQVERFSP
jgi:GT2 family glycosyltransferase